MVTGIYAITNKLDGKMYVGSAKNIPARYKRHLRDLRLGKHSSIKLQRAFNKYHEESFELSVLEIVQVYDKNLMFREQFWIDGLDSKKLGYNIADASFGDTLSNHPNKADIIEKRRNTSRENMKLLSDDEKKEKYGMPGNLNGMYGREHTEVSKNKITESYKKLYEDGYINPMKGKHLTPDHKKILSEHASGRTGELNPFFGRSHTEDTKSIISSKNKGRLPPNTKKVCAEGITYISASECARRLNVTVGLICYRIKSDKYDYRYL